MARAGRNDICPCGSGQKYKRCCLPRDQAAEHSRLAREAAEASAALAAHNLKGQVALEAWLFQHDVNQAANAVIALVHRGALNEAEWAAQEMLTRFPTSHAGYQILGEIYEIRGWKKEAALCYRHATELVLAGHENDRHLAETFRTLVARLDPEGRQQTLLVEDTDAGGPDPVQGSLPFK